MAVEDLSAYSILDSNSRYTRTESRVTFTALPSTEDAYVYKDKTAAFFSGDFVHLLTVEVTACDEDGRCYVWGLTNTVNDMKGIDDASGSYVSVHLAYNAPNYRIVVEECDSGSIGQDEYLISLNTPYYLKIVRDEAVGTYGTFYCYIYSDSGRTNLLDTIYQTLSTSKKDFQYIFCGNTRNSGVGGRTISGYCENLELVGGSSSGSTPTVATLACINTVAESTTGLGYFISLGSSAVTAHGHCWGTSPDPNIVDDSSVDNGAIANLAHFMSPITDLIPGTPYYVRAFATNTSGTAYGENVTVAGDVTTIGRRYWWVDGEDFHWWGRSGTERKAQGIAVASDHGILGYFD